MIKKSIPHISLLLSATSLLASCVSTDTLEPSVSEADSNYIVLSVSSPPDVSTRAGTGYKLRYTAKIFTGASSSNWGSTPIDRQEIIEGESSDNKIVFKVDPDNSYTVMVFADYIPSDFKADESGHYPDYFYNTTNSKRSTVRTTPGSDEEKVSAEFFNNDNYDCFYVQESVVKKEKEVNLDLTLKRVTSQVIFREKSENKGIGNVSVSKLGYRKHFDWGTMNTFDPIAPNTDLGTISLPKDIIIDEDKDLFYFYSLAETGEGKRYVSVEFTVNREGCDSKTFTIKEIPVRSNHRTIVKGEYLPVPEVAGEDPIDNSGDIILNLTTDLSWEEESLEK